MPLEDTLMSQMVATADFESRGVAGDVMLYLKILLQVHPCSSKRHVDAGSMTVNEQW